MNSRITNHTTCPCFAPVFGGPAGHPPGSVENRKRLPRSPLSLGCLLLAAMALHSPAATVTWTNTTGGLWSKAANWNPNQVPGASDIVLITQPGTYTVTLDVSATVDSLAIGTSSGLQRLTNYANNLTINSGATVNANGIVDWSGGSIGGPGGWQVNANGLFNWRGGSVLQPLTVGAGGVLNLTNAVLRQVQVPLTNWGTVNWGGGQLHVYNDASVWLGGIYNEAGGVFDVKCDQPLTAQSGAGWESFANNGTFRKSAGPGTTTVSVPFNNSGTVEVQTGTVLFNWGGMLGGRYTMDAGAAITLGGGMFVQSGLPAFTGAGLARMVAGSLTLTTDVISGLDMAGGNLYLAPTFQNGSITNLTLNGMVLYGANTVSGVLDWQVGQVVGALTVGAGGVLNLTNAVLRQVQVPLTNWGTVNWGGGQLHVYNDASVWFGGIYNEAGGVFDVKCDQPLTAQSGAGWESFANNGTFRKSAGPGTTTVSVPFNNSGTILSEKGTLLFDSIYSFTPNSNLRFTLNGTNPGIDFGQVRFVTPWDPTNGVVSGQVATGFHPPSGTQYRVISGGLAQIPLHVDRNAGNGYVFDYFRRADTLTLVTRPADLTLPPHLSLLHGYPGTLSLLMEGQPGLDYRLLSNTNLASTNWTTFYTTNTPDGLIQVLVTNTPLPSQFYRAVTP